MPPQAYDFLSQRPAHHLNRVFSLYNLYNTHLSKHCHMDESILHQNNRYSQHGLDEHGLQQQRRLSIK